MKKVSYILFIISICSFFSCSKKDDPKVVGSLYGSVTDKATGEPVKYAKIELMPTGMSVRTGDDGNFEFVKIEQGSYNLYVTKSGYMEYKTNDIPINEDSKDRPVNILLEKLPPALQVVNDSRQEIDTISFGGVEGDEMRSFNIFNNSEDPLEWQIVYKTNWIESFSKEEGILDKGKTQTIVVTIDRTKLNPGLNSTVVHIVSDNGSKQLTITATSIGVLETLEVTEITPSSAVLNGKFNKMPTSSVIEYGFVYGTMPTPSLDNGAIKVTIKGSAHVGNYSYAINLTNEETYFVRAFAKTDTEEYYGETHSFIAQDVPYVILLKAGIMVQKVDLGDVFWNSAVAMCESSIVGGFTDWRLPTIEELMTLYTEREHIGGFQSQASYWSSSKYGSATSYYITFGSGSVGYAADNYYSKRVRAVRSIK